MTSRIETSCQVCDFFRGTPSSDAHHDVEYTDLLLEPQSSSTKFENSLQTCSASPTLVLTCDHLFFVVGLNQPLVSFIPGLCQGPQGLTTALQNCNNGSEFEKCLCRPLSSCLDSHVTAFSRPLLAGAAAEPCQGRSSGCTVGELIGMPHVED